jgi:GST-like protein
VYTLYGKKGSGSASVEAALGLAGAPYRIIETASWETNDAYRDLLVINPIGQIPTLVLPDGDALSESAAILIHLHGAFPQAGLLPPDAAARAQAIRGLVFIAANCYSAITVIDFPERFCSDADDAIKERIRTGTRARLHRHWEIFADMFAPHPFLAGADVGALDLYASVVSKWSGARRHIEQQRPEFFAALQRTETHPKVAAVFERHWPAK